MEGPRREELEGPGEEEVDTPDKELQRDPTEAATTPVTPRAVNLTITDSTGADPVPQPTPDDEEEDQLNKTLTPTKEETMQIEDLENQPLIKVESLEPAPEGDYVKRSGTFRKSKPSLTPVPAAVVGAEGGGHQLEAGSADEAGMSGDYTRRSGTFRKEKPFLSTTAPQIDMATDSIAMETDTVDAGDPVKDERNVSPLQIEPPIDAREDSEAGPNSPEELPVDQEESGLRRSTTFRKEKPTLEVSPIVRREVDSPQSGEHRDHLDNDLLYRTHSAEPPAQGTLVVVPTLSLTLPPHTDPAGVYPEESGSEGSGEESWLLVDSLGGGRGVQRSGTFTKERPEHSLFGDDYF
jgi:hypothetical protein